MGGKFLNYFGMDIDKFKMNENADGTYNIGYEN